MVNGLVSRAVRGPSWAAAVAVLLAVLLPSLPASPPAHAAGARPSFQMPFRCGERWEASTRSGHTAIDWNFGNGSDDSGKRVTAAAAGVAKAKYHHAYGYYIDIDHGNGWVTRYAHLLSRGLAEGPVAQGEVIGYVGSSGSSTAPHLHWEQIADGTPQSTLTADETELRPDGRSYTSRNCLRRDPFVSGDIDGDGDDDLAARFVRADGSSRIRTIRGRASRSLEPGPTLSLAKSTLPPSALLSLADTNRDGRADLNAAYRRDGGVQIASLYGAADGSFGELQRRFHASSWPFARLDSMRADDVDGDGIADLVARFVQADHDSVVRIIPGSSSTQLQRVVRKTIDAEVLPKAAQVSLGDTNGDGRSDLNAVAGHGTGVALVTFYGRADAGFGRRRVRYVNDSWPSKRLKTVRVGDTDGDGTDDFVLRFLRADGSSSVRIVRGAGTRLLTGTSSRSVTAADLPANAHVTIGDTNGSGRDDLNVANRVSGDVRYSSFFGTTSGALGDRRTRYVATGAPFHRLC